jgi:hypothetical protein
MSCGYLISACKRAQDEPSNVNRQAQCHVSSVATESGLNVELPVAESRRAVRGVQDSGQSFSRASAAEYYSPHQQVSETHWTTQKLFYLLPFAHLKLCENSLPAPAVHGKGILNAV